MTNATLARDARDLQERIQDGPSNAGSVKVHSLRVEAGPDPDDEQALFVTLVLEPPAPGQVTWPIDDVLRLRREVLSIVRKSDLEVSVYVTLTPMVDD